MVARSEAQLFSSIFAKLLCILEVLADFGEHAGRTIVQPGFNSQYLTSTIKKSMVHPEGTRGVFSSLLVLIIQQSRNIHMV
jgi:hypothetical protein